MDDRDKAIADLQARRAARGANDPLNQLRTYNATHESITASPQATDAAGCNLDPMKCDCTKGDYCPLWNEDWAAFYNNYTPMAKRYVGYVKDGYGWVDGQYVKL